MGNKDSTWGCNRKVLSTRPKIDQTYAGAVLTHQCETVREKPGLLQHSGLRKGRKYKGKTEEEKREKRKKRRKIGEE